MCQNVNIIVNIWSPNLAICAIAKIGGCIQLSLCMGTVLCVVILVTGQWPTWWCSLIGWWGVEPACHVLVTVSEQGANIGGWLYISFIKYDLFHSTAFIFSIVKRIQLEFQYDIKTCVFLIGTKFRGDMRSCSVVACWVKICKFTKNKQGVSQCFHLHVRAPPTSVPGWADERRVLRQLGWGRVLATVMCLCMGVGPGLPTGEAAGCTNKKIWHDVAGCHSSKSAWRHMLRSAILFWCVYPPFSSLSFLTWAPVTFCKNRHVRTVEPLYKDHPIWWPFKRGGLSWGIK